MHTSWKSPKQWGKTGSQNTNFKTTSSRWTNIGSSLLTQWKHFRDIKIYEISIKNMSLKMSLQWQPYCLGLIVLKEARPVLLPATHNHIRGWYSTNYDDSKVKALHLSVDYFPKPINAATKWSSICKRHFEIHFLDKWLLYFNSNAIEVWWRVGLSFRPMMTSFSGT